MRSLHCFPTRLESGLLWTARLLAAALVGLVGVISLGENGFRLFRPTTLEAIQMTLFLAACIGLVVAWEWPVLGGAGSRAFASLR